MKRWFGLWGLCLVVLLCATIGGCQGVPSASRLMVLGIDGLDPDVVTTMIGEGQLPHFKQLRDEGIFGVMHSAPPLLSPIIWTTIATGHKPSTHGIGHFTTVDPVTGQEQPVSSSLRKVKAVWNLFSEAGKKVAVVGWWATWPAEEVNGTIVSDHTAYHFLMDDQAPRTMEAVTWPDEALAQLQPMIRRPEDLQDSELEGFVDLESAPVSDAEFAFEDDLGHFKWALATAKSYRDIALHLWQSERPDLLMAYFEGVDSSSHLFGHLFRQEQELGGELAEQQNRFGNTVEAMYLLADEILGEFMAVMDDNTTLMVLSDHGFQLGELPDDPTKTRDMRRVSEAFHRENASLFLYGKNIRPKAEWKSAETLDVTPTLLALADLPVAEDMPGRALAETFESSSPVEKIATYETGEPKSSSGQVDRSSGVDEAVLSRLRSLGYLGSGTEPTKNDRNLASILLREGEYREAARAFNELVVASPDDAVLHAGLATALSQLGRSEEALKSFARALELDPLLVQAHFNRALFYEQQGEREKAVEDYRQALKIDSDYRPARQALDRLGESGIERVASNEAEVKAASLLQQARSEAQRGNYAEADDLLLKAEKLVPGETVVLQYRSNIAYLRGDLDAAIELLEKALEKEPDNSLFQQNLRRLRDQRSAEN